MKRPISRVRDINGRRGSQIPQEKKLYFDEVNVVLIKKFQRYLSGDLRNKQNTVHANLKVIRRIITEAISEELMLYDKNPFIKIKLRCEKSYRTFLLDDELMKLEELKLRGDSRMEYHRDLYIFSAYSISALNFRINPC